jgi:hypothetical protein
MRKLELAKLEDEPELSEIKDENYLRLLRVPIQDLAYPKHPKHKYFSLPHLFRDQVRCGIPFLMRPLVEFISIRHTIDPTEHSVSAEAQESGLYTLSPEEIPIYLKCKRFLVTLHIDCGQPEPRVEELALCTMLQEPFYGPLARRAFDRLWLEPKRKEFEQLQIKKT